MRAQDGHLGCQAALRPSDVMAAATLCSAALSLCSRNLPEAQERAQGWPAPQAWLREASVLLPGVHCQALPAVPARAADTALQVAAESCCYVTRLGAKHHEAGAWLGFRWRTRLQANAAAAGCFRWKR